MHQPITPSTRKEKCSLTCGTLAGLTEDEKAEGERAKDALEEEAGGNEEDGDYKGKSQFFTHLKKSEVSHCLLYILVGFSWLHLLVYACFGRIC